MSKNYSPRRFFRQAPNYLLKQYFDEKKIPLDVDFSKLTETKVDPIYQAWLGLPKEMRDRVEQDFQEIDTLASQGGSKAILDVALNFGENLAEQFAKLKGFHEHAFWTFLQRPTYWQPAVVLSHADSIATSYWRKRNNLPKNLVDISVDNIKKFEQELSNYFHTTQGRGNNCKIDYYKRNESDYFFAYPEDYAQASIEWEEKEFKRRPHHPAFEIIFVYSQKNGTLDILMMGDKKALPELQKIFAAVILKASLGNDPKDERVYDLSPLFRRDFTFIFSPESGISSVALKKLRLKVHNKNEKIIIEVDPKHNQYAIYDLLDKVLNIIPSSQISITQAGIQVKFAANSLLSKKACVRNFDISLPNSCSLKHDDLSSVIRKVLSDSGIEPSKAVRDDIDG